MANAGYTEYHASQVEMMKLIGTASIDKPCHFSMSDCIETFGESKPVREFMNAPYNHSVTMLGRGDFPANIVA